MTPAALSIEQSAPSPVPVLREDLQLHPSTPDHDGAPAWTIHDPLIGRYYRIGLAAFCLLGAWHHRDPERVLAAATRDSTVSIMPEDLEELVVFLRTNNLVSPTSPGQMESYLKQVQATKIAWYTQVLHHYLFFRIPLVRPDRWLKRLAPHASVFFAPRFHAAMGALALAGLMLLFQQWDQFFATFMHFFTWQGALMLSVTLAVSKILHECGHALAARRYGCRVHSMGVAFLVMFPVLYTDVTDAWRLTDRRQRMIIASAGIFTELMLAIIATFAWSFLPEGPLKSAAFMLATVTWITTLGVNLNPLMKFDGYFIFSDLVGIDNLQDRAFAMCCWRLREALFGFGDAAPEYVNARQYRILLIWGYVVWVWRLILFIGIALLVYHLFFKLLGIFLMLVEIGWFIARPVKKEVSVWWSRRADIHWNRNTRITVAALAGLLAVAIIPWESQVTLPASLHARDYQSLFPVAPSRIAAVHARAGQPVSKDDMLYELESPDLEFEWKQVQTDIALLRAVIARQAASDDMLDQLSVLESELASHLTRRDGLAEQREKLVVRAPVTGILRDVPEGLDAGVWVNPSSFLGRVVAGDQALVVAYVTERDLNRLQTGALGRFVPDDPAAPSVPVRVERIDATSQRTLDNPYVASVHGGDVAVRQGEKSGLIPVEAQYRVWLLPTRQHSPVNSVMVGDVRVEAAASSWLASIWRQAWTVLWRETGF